MPLPFSEKKVITYIVRMGHAPSWTADPIGPRSSRLGGGQIWKDTRIRCLASGFILVCAENSNMLTDVMASVLRESVCIDSFC